MNDGLRFGLYFLGGMVVGVLGAVAVSRGKLDVRPVAADLLSRGIDVKDAFMGKVDALKEGMEDLAAEARQASEKRREAKASEA